MEWRAENEWGLQDRRNLKDNCRKSDFQDYIGQIASEYPEI